MKKVVMKSVAILLVVMICVSATWAAKKEVAKPKKLVVFLDTVLEKEWGQDPFMAEFQKQTGIELEIIKPVHNQYYEKLRLAFASGEFPDIVEIADPTYTSFAVEGAFIDLGSYIKKSAICKEIDKKHFEAVKVNQKIYGFPSQIGTGPITYIRKDWLDNLGLKAPTTWDEFYNVMKAFTFNDPDKNGKNDTFGMTSPGTTDGTNVVFADNYYRDIFQKASPEYIVKNGKWVDGFSQPEFKPALERLRKIYQEGIIDPEIFTNQTSACREKFTSGKCGIFPYWYGSWNVKLEQDLQKKLGASAKMIPIPAIKGSYYIARVPWVHAIPIKSKIPEAAFKYFIEYMHDGGPGQMLFTHGVENVHWTQKEGVYTPLPYINDPKKPFDKTYIPADLVITPWKDPFPMDDRLINSRDLFLKSYRQAVIAPMPELRVKMETEILNLKNETFGKVLTGKMTVDQGLAEYKKRAAELGINKVLAAMNEKK